jgi:hypothetical protein
MAFKVIELSSPSVNQQQNDLPTFRAEPEETYAQQITRTIPALAARAGESLVGLPRSMGEFAQSIGNFAFRGTAPDAPDYPLGQSIPFLPTAQTAREYVTEPISQLITGKKGALEPQSGKEQFVQTVASEAAPFFLSGGRTAFSAIARGLGISAAGNLIELASKTIGLPEILGKGLKAGSMIGLSFLGKPNAKAFAGEIYKTNTEAIPEESITEARSIMGEIRKIRDYTKTGDTNTPSKDFLRNFVDKLENKITNGSIRMRELPQFQKDYNEWFSEGKVPKNATPFIQKLFDSFDKAALEAPDAARIPYQNLETGRDIYRAIHASNKIEEFIENSPKLSSIIKKGGPLASMIGLVSNPAKGGALGGLGLLGYGTYDFIDKAARFPGMQHYYGKLITSLLKEDATAAINAASKMAKYFESPSKERGEEKSSFKVVSLAS